MTQGQDIFARERELGLTRPKKVAVVGCGGVGSWVAYMLAMAGVEELWLFDMDTVSEHNRNRVPVMAEHIGRLKTEAMQDMISMVRPDCRIYAMRGFSPELMEQVDIFSGGVLEWIIATTDTHASRRMVYDWACQYGVKYLEAAAEGEAGSITGQPAEWATEEEAQPGYASVPVWVGSSVAAASMACYYVLHDQMPCDNSLRLEWERRGQYQADRLRFTHHGPDAPVNDEPQELPDGLPEPVQHQGPEPTNLDLLCATCGRRFGQHYGVWPEAHCDQDEPRGRQWVPDPEGRTRADVEATDGGDFNIVENNSL